MAEALPKIGRTRPCGDGKMMVWKMTCLPTPEAKVEAARGRLIGRLREAGVGFVAAQSYANHAITTLHPRAPPLRVIASRTEDNEAFDALRRPRLTRLHRGERQRSPSSARERSPSPSPPRPFIPTWSPSPRGGFASPSPSPRPPATPPLPRRAAAKGARDRRMLEEGNDWMRRQVRNRVQGKPSFFGGRKPKPL